MTISQRIFAILREKKLSQKELSQYTGISPAAISSWKSKGTNPSSDKIISICEFLEVDPYYLLTGHITPEQPMVCDDSIPYNTGTAVEQLMLMHFHRLSPLDQGRIIGIMEQMLSQQQTEQ